MNFATTIRNLRIERGLSQMDLAKALKISQSSIALWESGERSPRFASVKKLADFFRVPVSAFAADQVQPDPEYLEHVSERIASNPRLRILFDRSNMLSDEDMDTVLAVVNSIAKEKNQ